MQLLLMTSIFDGVVTNTCNFELAVDGGAFQAASTAIPGPAQFSLDDLASFIDIRATPQSADFWPVQGRFKFAAPGALFAIDASDRSAADMATTLRDLQGCMFRRAGVYDPPPELGRVAIGAFSGANALLSGFLNDPANRAHPFVLNNLREVYSFDVVDDGVAGILAAIVGWGLTMAGTDTRAHVYRQGNTTLLDPFFPPAARPGPRPFVATTPDRSRTLGLIPAATWRAAAAARGFPAMGFQFTEIPTTCFQACF